jgi:uroporphyrinogen-III synthase
MEIVSNQKTYALFLNVSTEKLAEKLESEGAMVFRFSPVTTRLVRFEESPEIIKNNLHEFDWIVLPDVFAVDHFLNLLEENKLEFFELDALRVMAFGEAVADRLRFAQLHADIIPSAIDADIIFLTLLNYLGKDDLTGMNFLMPKGLEFKTDLTDKLIERGANVSELAVYEIESGEKDKTAKIKALLKGGAIDEFIFDSPEDILSLKYYLANAVLSEIMSGIKILGTNETMLHALRENALHPHFFNANKRG